MSRGENITMETGHWGDPPMDAPPVENRLRGFGRGRILRGSKYRNSFSLLVWMSGGELWCAVWSAVHSTCFISCPARTCLYNPIYLSHSISELVLNILWGFSV